MTKPKQMRCNALKRVSPVSSVTSSNKWPFSVNHRPARRAHVLGAKPTEMQAENERWEYPRAQSK